MTEGAKVSSPVVPGFHDLDVIGTGGFSVVYRALDDHIERAVAVKVFRDFDPTDIKARDRFLRESRAMGRLSGIRHIVDIYQATFTEDGRPCIVMPLLEGGSLADRLRSGPLSAREVQQIGITIAEALDEAHRKGICHRDIKPENILQASDGSLGLTDFGIAIMEDSRIGTRTQGAVSPQHAPPERLALAAGATSNDVTGDVYSLASTLYMLLTGRGPFGSSDELGFYEFTRRVVEDPVPSIQMDGVPTQFSLALEQAMDKQPAKRPASAQILADLLRAVPREQLSVKAAQLQPPAQTIRSTKTDPTSDTKTFTLPAAPLLPPKQNPDLVESVDNATIARPNRGAAPIGALPLPPTAARPTEPEQPTQIETVEPLTNLGLPDHEIPQGATIARRLPETTTPETDKPKTTPKRLPTKLITIGIVCIVCIVGIAMSIRMGSPSTTAGSSNCTLRDRGQNVDLHGCDLSGFDLTGAELSGANLWGATLTGANLTSANLSGANLDSANLSGANLDSANLIDAYMAGANMDSANLTGATLTSADLGGANLGGANLTIANLDSANLYGANLTLANLNGASLNSAWWHDTTCPDGHKTSDPCA